MKKILSALVLLAFCSSASASVVEVLINEQLPPDGTAQYDLDGDGVDDIGLAEDCCRDETLWINGSGHATQWQWAFVQVGDVIDGTLDWVSGVMDYTDYLDVGESYVAAFDTTSGAFYGYMTILFDGTDTWLQSYHFEDSGAAITVAASAVPVPAAVWLFGSGLLGLAGMSKRKKTTAAA